MAITAVYYITRAGGYYRRSLDGGTTWEDVPGYTASSASTFGLDVGMNPYSYKNIQLLAQSATPATFYSNDSYVTNDSSTLYSSFVLPRIQVIDKNVSYLAETQTFRRSGDSFGTYTNQKNFSINPTLPIGNSVRFYMSCRNNGILAINDDNDPYLYRTQTAGTTWSPLNSGGLILQPSHNVGGVWCDLEATTVVAVTDNTVYRSTDSGNTFTSVLSFTDTTVNTLVPVSGGSANCIYFVDSDGNVWKSSNLGASWITIVTVPATPSDPLSIAFDANDEGFVGVDDALYRIYKIDANNYAYELSETSSSAILNIDVVTYECGCPTGFTYNPATDQCEKLDPSGKFGNLFTDFIKCPYLLQNCYDSEDIIYADGDTSINMDAFVSKVIPYNEGCYQVHNAYSLVPNMVTIDASALTPSDTCFECRPLYNLYSCDDTETVAYCTDSDLSEAHAAGSIISIAIDGEPQEGCYIIGQNNEGLCDVTTSNITVTTEFTTCALCTAAIYKLTNCLNNDISVYIVSNDFSQYKNKSIILEEYPALCWSVEEVTLVGGDIITGTVKEVYSDCACCKQYSCN